MSRKAAWALAAAVALGAAGWWALRPSGPAAPEAGRYEAVHRGNLLVALEAEGTVRPKYQVEIKSKASGQILRFDKREGDAVEPGEVLVILDKTVEERNLQRAQAMVTQAQAQLDRLRADMERAGSRATSEVEVARAERDRRRVEFERLTNLGTGTASPQELENARAASVQAEERLRQAEGEVRFLEQSRVAEESLVASELALARVAEQEAQDRLRDTEVRSPIAGVLLDKLVEAGQIVASGTLSVSGGTAIAVVGDLSELIVEAAVDETDIAQISVDQRAFVEVESVLGRKFEGTVDHVAPMAEAEQQIPRIPVRVVLRGQDFSKVPIGVRATVEFILEERENVVLVPSDALTYEGRRVKVRTQARGSVEIEIGADNGLEAEVTGGLTEGESVWVPQRAIQRERW